MKRVSKGNGFFVSVIINMVLRPEWPVVAAVLFFVHHYVEKVSIWWGFGVLIVWFVYCFILTAFISWVGSKGSDKPVEKKNVNPYSQKGVPTIKNNVFNNTSQVINAENMCPCCGKFKLDEVGKYEICGICGWEDDPVQRKDPDFDGGANIISLNEARDRYRNEIGD